MIQSAAKWLWMQQTFGVGNRRVHDIYTRFGSPEELLSREMDEEDKEFLTEKEMAAIKAPELEACERIISEALDFGASVLTPDMPEFSESLANIPSIPLILYYKGDISLLKDHYLISMVGTRNPDEYGLAAAKKLSGEVASAGGVVVSGLAHGIDAACHRAALEAGGKTIAFVGCGLDIDYPKRNRALRSLIERPENGLVLSEYPVGTPALPHHFPLRNRLISGCSLATVVVQSALSGGTMVTAAHALGQNRDLFAVPGSILSDSSAGCNQLIAQGAEPALDGRDIVLRYEGVYRYPLTPPAQSQTSLFERKEKPAPPARPAKAATAGEEIPDYLNDLQARALRRLGGGTMAIDDLCEALEIPGGEGLTLATGLELFGLVELLPGRRLRRI